MAQLFNAEKKTGHLMISTVTASVTNIVAMIVLAPMIGILGAPISLVIANIVNIVIRYFNIKKYVKFSFNILEIFKLIFLVGTATIVFYKITNIYMLIVAIILFAILSLFIYKDVAIIIGKQVLGLFQKDQQRIL